MNWTIFGRITDILSVLSFIISLGIFRKIYAKAEMQKTTYENERINLLTNLCALQKSIWEDGLKTMAIQDLLQQLAYEYRQKYLFISSPLCIFHVSRCIHLLQKGINDSNLVKIRQDINYLIARLSKKE